RPHRSFSESFIRALIILCAPLSVVLSSISIWDDHWLLADNCLFRLWCFCTASNQTGLHYLQDLSQAHMPRLASGMAVAHSVATLAVGVAILVLELLMVSQVNQVTLIGLTLMFWGKFMASFLFLLNAINSITHFNSVTHPSKKSHLASTHTYSLSSLEPGLVRSFHLTTRNSQYPTATIIITILITITPTITISTITTTIIPISTVTIITITLKIYDGENYVVSRPFAGDVFLLDKDVVDCRDPFTVADLGVLASCHRAFLQALPRVPPFCAVKCNSSPWVLRVLATLGTSFDCASQVELEQVLGLGMAPSCIIYAYPCKAVPHIEWPLAMRNLPWTYGAQRVDCGNGCHPEKLEEPNDPTQTRLSHGRIAEHQIPHLQNLGTSALTVEPEAPAPNPRTGLKGAAVYRECPGFLLLQNALNRANVHQAEDCRDPFMVTDLGMLASAIRLVLRLWTQDSESILPLSAKFGASLEVCEHMLKSARDLGLAVVGTRCKTPHSFTQAITNCRCMFEMGCGVSHDMSLLDIGGGFPGEKGSDSKFE
ncbi:hypothetical protein E2I00_012254, partial [Balaenoptera physalus]